MIGVKDEQHVERALEHRIGLVLKLGHLEEHREEVAGVAQVVVGVHVGQATRMPVRPRRDGRHFADQPAGLEAARLELKNTLRVRIESGHRSDGSHQHAHRMRVVAKAVHEALDVLVHHRVNLDVVLPDAEVLEVGQLAFYDQIRGLEIVALLGEFLDGIAAVAEDSPFAVDEGHFAAARRGVDECGVVGHQAEVVGAAANLAKLRCAYDAALLDGDLVGLAGAVISNGERVLRHVWSSPR